MQELSLSDKGLSTEFESITKYLEDSLSFNTRRTYANAVSKFLEWGGTLPCDINTVARYLNAFAGKRKFSTLTHRIKAIRQWHIFNRYPDPTSGRDIKQLMQGIRNTHPHQLKQAPDLTVDDIRKIHTALKAARFSFRDKRNLAMIMIGYFGFLRQSEIIAIRYKHLKWCDEGLILFIPYSKTDQKREGQRVAINYGKEDFCPLQCLKEWLDVSNIKKGFVFRRMPNSYTVGEKGMNHAVIVSIIVKRAAKKAGLKDPKSYSGHSLRCGPATDALRKGASAIAIQKQGRWVNHTSMIRYIRKANLFDDNVTSILLN